MSLGYINVFSKYKTGFNFFYATTFKCLFATKLLNYSNIIKSKVPHIQVPNKTIPQFIFENFSKLPYKTAVECGLTGRKYTFEELQTKSINLNKSLRKRLKLKERDVVGILLPNVPEYPICVLGSIEAGLVVTPINPWFTSEEIKSQLLNANVKAIFTLTTLWNNVKSGVDLTHKNIMIITIKPERSLSIPESAICFQELVDSKCDIDDLISTSVHETAIMLYSSGTTGLPKGVEHTHYTVNANIMQMNGYYFKINLPSTDTHQDIVPAVLPLFHIFGLVTLLNQLWNLSKIVSLPQYNLDSYIHILKNHKPHILYLVPPIIINLLNNPMVKKSYLEPVRSVFYGGAPLAFQDEECFAHKFGDKINMIQGYGLTESMLILSTPNKKFTKSGSIGELLPNTYAKIVHADNPTTEALGPHNIGELLIKGPQVMKSYYKNPKATNETFIDGWMRTGDLLYYDDNNMFYIKGRIKEMIKVKAYQVAPAELEEVLKRYPGVSEAVVLGVPDKIFGEVPKAYIVPKENQTINIEELEAFFNKNVVKYKQLKGGIKIIQSIPKSVSGKVLKTELSTM